MSSSARQSAATDSLLALPARLQQRPFRFLLFVGLGTTSLFLAQRYSSSIWSSLASLFGRNRNGAPLSPSSPPARDLSTTITSSKAAKSRTAAKYLVKEDADSVAIFWDVDNCAPPTGSSGRVVAQAVRSSLQNLELGPIVSFKAYLELSSETSAPSAQQVQLRSELQGSGVSLIDTPKSGRKDVADKMMITDLLAFAIGQPAPATIVLISGDRDFAYPLGLLRNRGYEIILITPPVGAVPILEASANVVLTWRQDVLGIERDSNGRLYTSMNGPSTPHKAAHANAKAAAAAAAASSSASNSASASVSSSAASHACQSSAATASPAQYGPLAQGRPSNAPTRSTRRPSVQSTEVFQPLVTLLEQLRKEGNAKPPRATVAARLISSNRGIYVRAGASRWAEYAAVAEAAGIITLGTSEPPGTEWVSLSDPTAGGATTSSNLRSLDATIGHAQSSPIPNRIKAPQTASTPQARASATATAMADAPLPDIRAFHPLIEVCKEQKAQGNPKPLSAYVGMQLSLMARQGLVDAYALAGVNSWREYIAAAEKAGVARTAPSDAEGVYVVELYPKHLYAQTSQVTPSVGRVVDTATTPTPGVEKKTPKKSLLNGFGLGASKSFLSSPRKDASLPTGTSVFNGHEIAAKFGSLAQVLLEQMGEGRNYSTDYFLHSILGSSRAIYGLRLKDATDFQAFLGEAVAEQIVTEEAGFKPGVKHVRLHPRLTSPGATVPASSGDAATNSSSERPADFHHHKRTGSSKRDGLNDIFSSSQGKSKERDTTTEKQKKTQDTLQQLSLLEKDKMAEVVFRTSSGPVPSNERLRFQILVEVLSELRDSEGLYDVPKARASSEVVKRSQGPGAMGAFYQTLGSTGFTDYVDQARKVGFVVIVAGAGTEEREIDANEEWQKDGAYSIRLAQ